MTLSEPQACVESSLPVIRKSNAARRDQISQLWGHKPACSHASAMVRSNLEIRH
jgi:hypothetical protein